MSSPWRSPAILLGPAVAYLVLLLGPANGPTTTLVLGHVVYFVPMIVLLRRGMAHPDERGWVMTLAGGILAFVVAADCYAFEASSGGFAIRVVNVAANLCVVPLFLYSMVAALRRHLLRVGRIVALDGVTGALAVVTVSLAALGPLVEHLWDDSLLAAAALVYPAGDVLLAATALGALGLVGLRDGRHFALWAFGMVVFSVGDIKFAYASSGDGSYSTGSGWDAVWAIGCGLMALGATSVQTPRSRRVPGTGSLAVVVIAAVGGVAVLTAAPVTGSRSATVMALVTLFSCGLRFVLAFTQLRDLTAVRVLALTDELTGLANRRGLYVELDRRLADGNQIGDLGGASSALLLIDLDHFKEVNDSFGHAAGDDLLRIVAARIAGAAESTGSPHLVSRLGGDEFAVVLHSSSAEEALACAAAIGATLREPIVLGGLQLHVQCSTGVAMAPQHARTRGDLLFAADVAMYAAKTSHASTGAGICMFTASLEGDRRKRLGLAEDLYSALEKDELVVEYQPIVAASAGGAGSRGLVGVEALVRWDHPVHGRIPPDDFLPVAERHRLTSLIAARVLDVALGDVARWHAAGQPLRVSVNISASDLGSTGIVDTIAAALSTHGVAPQVLTIEVTETAMMRDPDAARSVMVAISSMGVRLSVDDYGTGYSSLQYLLRLPIDEIKLDRAFLRDLSTPRAVAIVRSTIDLTHALGLHMVAEGVEDEAALVVLRDLGCDLAQGWHLGRPAAVGVLEELIGIAGRAQSSSSCPVGGSVRSPEEPSARVSTSMS